MSAAVLELVRAAETALERNRARLDDLNVFPVPDGDTGTNMLLTVRAVTEPATAAESTGSAWPRKLLTRALLGARGNSGVILSQIVRGASEVLAGAEPVDAETVARALRRASDEAYAAVQEPEEGTILTVIRALAEEAEAANRSGRPAALRRARAPGRRSGRADARAARAFSARPASSTPGAAGLVEIVRGIAAHLAGEPLPERDRGRAARAGRGPPGGVALPLLHGLRRRG